MAKTKRGPSFFEILRKDGTPSEATRLNVPGWWSRRKGAEPPARPSQEAPTGTAPPTRTPGSQAPLIAVDGPRLILSFSSFSAALTVLVLAAVLTGTFFIGQFRGLERGRAEGFSSAQQAIADGAMDDIQRARRSRPEGELFAGMPSSPVKADSAKPLAAVPPGRKADPPAQPASGHKWVKGHTYIVVQEFLETDLEQAEKARDFLKEHGVPTEIVHYGGRSNYKYRLVTQKGFNCDDPVQKRLCNEYHQEIRKLGDLFVRAGGRYNLQGYQKKAIGVP